LLLGVAAFFLFNFVFLPPYYTLELANPLDWLILVTFLITSVVAAELFQLQQRQAALAAARAKELDQLASLGAETLKAPRAEQALDDIAEIIRETVAVETCELFIWESDASALQGISMSGIPKAESHVPDSAALMEYVARQRESAIEREDGTIHVIGHADDSGAAGVNASGLAFAIPLVSRDETVGALRVSGTRPFNLSLDQWRRLSALAYYAALAIYRLKLQRAEEATESLRRADRLKDALLASVSHDLRTPLTTIKGIAHEIAAEGSNGGKTIEIEADRLSGLVDGLLEMSKIDAGGVAVNMMINTVDDLFGAALQRAESVLGNHRVETVLPGDPLLAGRFDFNHSLRILVNLLENAAKYSPPDIPIVLSAYVRGSRLHITVSDRGKGVPDGERERIFEPFYRIRGSQPDVRGAGLGLSIARRLAELQGGSLLVSDNPGGGASFTLALSAAEPQSG
jgi:two-component system sensor histidine kinase KdpD